MAYRYIYQHFISPQGVLENFDDIVLCAGTAGTCGAVAVANYLTGSKIKYVMYIHTAYSTVYLFVLHIHTILYICTVYIYVLYTKLAND